MKFYFKSIDILLPSDWSAASCGVSDVITESTYQTSESADVVVSERYSVYTDSNVRTEQPDGCGQPGTKIYIPRKFLFQSNDTSEQGKTISTL